jgi:hypothetical protein
MRAGMSSMALPPGQSAAGDAAASDTNLKETLIGHRQFTKS